MDWLNLLEQFVTIVVFPCIGLLAIYLVKYIHAKSVSLQNQTQSDIGDKYIQMVEDTITACVLATN
jgi:hypothetical protein